MFASAKEDVWYDSDPSWMFPYLSAWPLAMTSWCRGRSGVFQFLSDKLIARPPNLLNHRLLSTAATQMSILISFCLSLITVKDTLGSKLINVLTPVHLEVVNMDLCLAEAQFSHPDCTANLCFQLPLSCGWSFLPPTPLPVQILLIFHSKTQTQSYPWDFTYQLFTQFFF